MTDADGGVTENDADDPVSINRSGLIGRGVDRYEGSAKVTGTAAYAADVTPPSPPAYGAIVQSTIARGRITAVATATAEAMPGVLLVWTHANVPPQGPRGFVKDPFADDQQPNPVMADDRVRYFGETVAFVVADTFEQAREAARAITVTYRTEPADYDFAASLPRAALPPEGKDARRGDFDAAFAQAARTVDEIWTTPLQNHLQMEPHASTAWWEGEQLTIHNANQMVRRAQRSIAATLQVAPEQVRLLTRYVGGGFGGKVFAFDDAVLAALAARALNRPVKVVLARAQMFEGTVHRPATSLHVRLGADEEGRLTALSMLSTSHCAHHQLFVEPAALFARSLYAAANRFIGHRVVQLDLPAAGPMRAPGEAPGMLALECAMDELAERVGLDPVELRLRNEPAVHPESGKPFSVRQLTRCLREGADRFGWGERPPEPRTRRDGRWWIGWGMAAAVRGNMHLPAAARIGLGDDGIAVLRQGMTDIGTGTYTILAQIAAESLGLPLSQVRVELGDSDFPPTPGSGGQYGAASAGSAAYAAALALRRRLVLTAVANSASALYRCAPDDARFDDGHIIIGNSAESLASIAARAGPDGIWADGACAPDKAARAYSQQTYGAHFVQVAVDGDTGEVRVRRMAGVFAAGRILNAKTARSQLLGGMIWGLSAALLEGNHIEARSGGMLARDAGEYLVPTCADIGAMEVHILDEVDRHANPLGAKGVGELGICGSGAAIANAIYNAVGVRCRDYPITPDKLLAWL